jgi:hypothetical protein
MANDVRMLTVTAPAATYDLTTVEAVKAELRLETKKWDELLFGFIHEQSRIVADECNRVFAKETVTETFRLDCARAELVLRRYPNIVMGALTEDGTALTAADYEIDDEAGLLYRLSDDVRIAWPSLKIVMSYTAGYELLDGLPEPIERTCKEFVKAAWFAARRDPSVKSEDIPGVYRVEYWIGDLPGSRGDWLRRLDPYRATVI